MCMSDKCTEPQDSVVNAAHSWTVYLPEGFSFFQRRRNQALGMVYLRKTCQQRPASKTCQPLHFSHKEMFVLSMLHKLGDKTYVGKKIQKQLNLAIFTPVSLDGKSSRLKHLALEVQNYSRDSQQAVLVWACPARERDAQGVDKRVATPGEIPTYSPQEHMHKNYVVFDSLAFSQVWPRANGTRRSEATVRIESLRSTRK